MSPVMELWGPVAGKADEFSGFSPFFSFCAGQEVPAEPESPAACRRTSADSAELPHVPCAVLYEAPFPSSVHCPQSASPKAQRPSLSERRRAGSMTLLLPAVALGEEPRSPASPSAPTEASDSCSSWQAAARPSLSARRQGAAALSLDTSRPKEDAPRPTACAGPLGDYVLQEMLGQGSCGTVYRAVRKLDGRAVALKLIRADDEERLASAEREYELLRSIEHPHVVKVLDFFTHARGAVVVMELLEGTDLRAAVRKAPERRLDEATAARLFRQLAETLAFLHGRGIVHRDVKAPNVMVSSDLQHLTLVDFNIAEEVDVGTCGADALLDTAGTPNYMAPEVLLGEASSEAVDVWGAGVCLHLMLLGKVPLRREKFDSHEDFGQALRGRAPVRESGRLSAAARRVLDGCLEADFTKRPTALGLLAEDWLAGGAALA